MRKHAPRSKTKKQESKKLPIPSTFKVESYDVVKQLETADAWLDQLAIRIDLKEHLAKLADGQENVPYGCVCFSDDEFCVFEIWDLILKNPLVPVDRVLERCESSNGICLTTVKRVRDAPRAVRRLTVLDLRLLETLLNPILREKLDSVFNVVLAHVPHPEIELLNARLDDDECFNYEWNPPATSYEEQALSSYARKLERSISEFRSLESRRFGEASVQNRFSAFLDDPVVCHLPQGSAAYLVVDTELPYADAERVFRQVYEEHQATRRNSKGIDGGLFGIWCAYGVLPYIDLMLLAEVEALKGNGVSKPKIGDQAFADWIERKGKGKGDRKAVWDKARRQATALMDPNSALFRVLLSRRSRGISN